MIDQYLQVPVGPPMDIRNVPLQPQFCSKLLLPSFQFNKPILKNDTMNPLGRYPLPPWSYSNCYSFHNKIFKNVYEANDFCKNAFGRSKEYTGQLAFGQFPHRIIKNEQPHGKSQIWGYLKPGLMQEIDDLVCSCQSSHNNLFIKLKDSSVCPEAKYSQMFGSKHLYCPAEFNIKTVCALVKENKFSLLD